MLEVIGGIVVTALIINWIQSIVSKNEQDQLIQLIDELKVFENGLKNNYLERQQLYNKVSDGVLIGNKENLNIAIYLLLYGHFSQRNYRESLLENEQVRTMIHSTALNIEKLLEQDMQY